MSNENEIAARIVAEALTWLGTPYRHQGSRKGVGCDCLGLVRGVLRAVYGAEPEHPGSYSADWAEAGGKDRLIEAARRHCVEKPLAGMAAGDLLVFRWRRGLPAKHCGILVGPDRFIHAYEGHAVVVSALVPSWRRRVAGVFSIPPLRPISPLAGEMSLPGSGRRPAQGQAPATEGGEGGPCDAPPSALPGISPSRGEIG